MQLDRFTTKSQEALQAAIALAASRRHTETQPEHLLAVLLEQAEGVIPPVLRKLGTSPEEIRRVVNEALDGFPTITAGAREPKLDPVIGRDDEIRRVIQVLSRRTKNNPVLIGEPGVGKTAIVEG